MRSLRQAIILNSVIEDGHLFLFYSASIPDSENRVLCRLGSGEIEESLLNENILEARISEANSLAFVQGIPSLLIRDMRPVDPLKLGLEEGALRLRLQKFMAQSIEHNISDRGSICVTRLAPEAISQADLPIVEFATGPAIGQYNGHAIPEFIVLGETKFLFDGIHQKGMALDWETQIVDSGLVFKREGAQLNKALQPR